MSHPVLRIRGYGQNDVLDEIKGGHRRSERHHRAAIARRLQLAQNRLGKRQPREAAAWITHDLDEHEHNARPRRLQSRGEHRQRQ